MSGAQNRHHWKERPIMVIPVTGVQIQAAHLRIKIDRKRGVRTPQAIVDLAAARPATPTEEAEIRASRTAIRG